MEYLNFDELFRVGRNEMLRSQVQFRASDIDTPGTQVNALVALGAALAEECIAHQRRDWKDSWLGSAEDAKLRSLVRDRYGVEAKMAGFSFGTVQFTINATLAAPLVIPIGTEVANTSGVTYRTTASATIPAGALGPIAADIVSLVTGPASRSAPGTIKSLRTQFSVVVNVTNTVATAGGEPEESDATIRARTLEAVLGQGAGTAAAIIKAARAVPGVTSAQAFELTGVLGMPERAIMLFVTDTFTEDMIISSPDGSPAYAEQSQALAKTVFNRLSDARPLGTPVYVYVAQVRLVPIRMALTYSANSNPSMAGAQAISSAVAFTNLHKPGAFWLPSSAGRSLLGIPGLLVSGNEFVTPSGPVKPSAWEVLRTAPSMVSI